MRVSDPLARTSKKKRYHMQISGKKHSGSKKLLTYFDEILARRAGGCRYAAGLSSQTRSLAALYRRFLLPQWSCLLQNFPFCSSSIFKLVSPREDGAATHHRRVRRPWQAAQNQVVKSYS